MRAYNEDQAVRNLQKYLRRLSYADPRIPPLPIDGIFEEQTRNALLAYQQTRGLEQTGRADRLTWDRLFAEYLEENAKTATPAPLYLFPRLPNNDSIKRGDRYYLVGIIQLLLNELAVAYDYDLPLAITEELDEATEERIRDFQRRNLLQDTGQVDLRTWERLADQFHKYATDYAR